MRKLIIMAFALSAFSFQYSTAAASAVPVVTPQEDEVSHGGGCRKSSPPGKCCHAGSKPYHCH